VASSVRPYRKLTKLGKHSYYVLIPPRFIEALGWQERQKLVVRRRGKKIVIEDWQKK
jgi:bifunctional DNA-binding transcriptional regulator/antitoxin component of YhaV-PrlF toxin-antitoxin module